MIGLIMAGNCERTIDLCIKSIINQVDKLVICLDTSSTDRTYEKILTWLEKNLDKLILIEREYEHDYDVKNANSNQRNFYLEYLKENFMGEWCLVIDADEVVDENLIKIKDDLKNEENITLITPRMIHFQQDLAHEDATKERHYVLNRLFKINENLFYPNGEHPVLQDKKNPQSIYTDIFIIYHFAYCREMFYIKERWKNHEAKSEMHTKKFLQDWAYSHYTGSYPKKDIPISILPKVILDYFNIDPDYFYFKNRGLETKHFIDSCIWRDYFKPQEVLFVGDGIGVRTLSSLMVGLNAFGFDNSKYAVENNLIGNERYWLGDITNDVGTVRNFELVVVYDVLEHLNKEQLETALINIYNITKKYLLISVPAIGDPNLYNDETHKMFLTMDEWKKKIEDFGFNIKEVPNNFLFKNQLILAEKNGVFKIGNS